MAQKETPQRNQINARLPLITSDQIEEIRRVTGMTKTQILIKAIDHMAEAVRGMKKRN